MEVRSAIEEVVSRLGGSFLKGRSFTVAGSTGPANVDPLRFRQIIRNLITNASRYGGDTIDVNLSEVDDFVEIAVADNGEGIPPELSERIFEPYTSAHSREGQPGSIGLGLTVARDSSRLMGGELTLAAEPGQTTFIAAFPLYRKLT